MKGYKAFGPDWTCRGRQYRLGETAIAEGDPEPGKNGIHFCENLYDCFLYTAARPETRLAKVEAVGRTARSENPGDPVCCTDALRILEEIPISELFEDADSRMEILKRDGFALQFIPKPAREECMAAVRANGLALQFVEEQDNAVCLTAVKQCGLAIQYVKERTPDLCMAAVLQDGRALSRIPREEQSEILCLEAVNRHPSMLYYAAYKTPAVYLAAVRKDGNALANIPVKERSQDLCMEAVKSRGHALHYVPKRSREICLAAVRQDPGALMYVPDQWPEICILAVQGGGPGILHMVRDPFVRERIRDISEKTESVLRKIRNMENSGRA